VWLHISMNHFDVGFVLGSSAKIIEELSLINCFLLVFKYLFLLTKLFKHN
jgi:hypothetical protein